ncbi:hypothetical protein [Brachybacterium fresconis]|uniref:Uncharacterized protein n=1 Tax=Brachybacterium fresconis TaxID=173363 RepID=A0ABS4YM02_9MICO|nr:hypothetical protein [Brachybacterium fresconis]MBP2409831.1 hypothetical protein [Brachybacterium fresconis]
MSAAPGGEPSPAQVGRTDTDAAAGRPDTDAEAADGAEMLAGEGAEADRPASLTSLTALLGDSATSGAACSVDGRCD